MQNKLEILIFSPVRIYQVLSKGGSAASGSENVNKYQKANQDFVQENKQQQQVLIKEQDQHLDQLDRSLSTIGQMARSINTELEEQSRYVTLYV